MQNYGRGIRRFEKRQAVTIKTPNISDDPTTQRLSIKENIQNITVWLFGKIASASPHAGTQREVISRWLNWWRRCKQQNFHTSKAHCGQKVFALWFISGFQGVWGKTSGLDDSIPPGSRRPLGFFEILRGAHTIFPNTIYGACSAPLTRTDMLSTAKLASSRGFAREVGLTNALHTKRTGAKYLKVHASSLAAPLPTIKEDGPAVNHGHDKLKAFTSGAPQRPGKLA